MRHSRLLSEKGPLSTDCAHSLSHYKSLMAFFSLLFSADDYGEVRLTACLDTGEFKGQCGYWCSPREFADLAAALATYPLSREAPIDGRWYDGCISLRIEPIDSVGHLSVSVGLEEFGSDWTRCRSRFHVSYGDIDRFREQLVTLLKDGSGEAVLSSG